MQYAKESEDPGNEFTLCLSERVIVISSVHTTCVVNPSWDLGVRSWDLGAAERSKGQSDLCI